MQSRTITLANSELQRFNDLQYYIITNNLSKVRQLVNRTNVNHFIDNTNKATALHISLQLQDSIITNFLLELGADPSITNINGKDSFALSIDYHKKCIYDFTILKKTEQIHVLIQDNQQLQKKLKVEKETNDYIVKSVDNYKAQISDLMSCGETLKTENSELKDLNFSKKRKIERLSQSNEQLINLNRK